MRIRAGRILLLLFQVVWLNAVLPGHTRGVVTLGGACDSDSQNKSASGCCPSKKSPAPKPQKGRECAVCFYAARVTPPPVVDLSLPPLQLLRLVEMTAPVAFDCRPLPPTYLGRAPPLV